MRPPITLYFLAGILFCEGALLAAATLRLGLEFFRAIPDRMAFELAIISLAFAATIWVVTMAIHTLRARPWIRAAAITWQILQAAVGLGLVREPFGRAYIAWALVFLAVAGLILLFHPSVVAATKRSS